MDIVSELNADLDDIQAHLDDMPASGAVVPGAHIALEGALHASKMPSRRNQHAIYRRRSACNQDAITMQSLEGGLHASKMQLRCMHDAIKLQSRRNQDAIKKAFELVIKNDRCMSKQILGMQEVIQRQT